MVSWWWTVILGFIISLSTMSMAARYVSLFFFASGSVGKALIPQDDELTEEVSWISQRFRNDASLGIERHSAASSVRQPIFDIYLRVIYSLAENVQQPLVLLMALATSQTCMSLCSQNTSCPPLLILPSEWVHTHGKPLGDLNTTNRWSSRSVR